MHARFARLCRVLTLPVRLATFAVHRMLPRGLRRRVRFAHKEAGRVTFAVCFILAGAWMATHPVEWCAHFIWDGVAYLVHGLGAAPIIERALAWFD